MQIFHIIRVRDTIWKSEHDIRFLFVCLFVSSFRPTLTGLPLTFCLSCHVFPILHGLNTLYM